MFAFPVLIILAVFGDAFGSTHERCWTNFSWNIENTKYIPFRRPSGVYIYVTCLLPGHLPNPPNLVKCIGNYAETSLPRCEKSESDCPSISSPVYGSMSCNSNPRRDGTTCWFKCSKDYYLIGSESRTCNNRLWSGSQPSCVRKVALPAFRRCQNDNGGCSHVCKEITNQARSWCECPPGWTLKNDRRTCEDEDECKTGKNHCQQKCFNTAPWYRCGCQEGYRLTDRHHCEDINECQMGRYRCQHICVNTVPGYRCECRQGYRLIDEFRCEEITPTRQYSDCTWHNGHCDQICSMYHQYGVECSCYDGYELAKDRKTCRQMNSDDDVSQQQHVDRSCGVRNGDCDHKCSQGAYGAIICSCHPGFILENNGKGCVDIDECATNNYGCSHLCQNLIGSARCLCPTGHRLSGDKKICLDIDECATNNYGCSHLCQNLMGSAICLCPTGHRLSGDKKTCLALGGGTVVSKRNTSEPNFQEPHVDRSGISCVLRNGGCAQKCSEEADGKVACSCNAGFKLGVDGKSCLDIDECATNNYGCSHRCQNVIGSAICLCPTGHRLSGDKKTCLALGGGTVFSKRNTSEPNFQEPHVDRSGISCVLRNGGCAQKCSEEAVGKVACSCNAGFKLGVDGKSCLDIDECAVNNYGCSHLCQNLRGSAKCLCREGYKLSQDKKTCLDIDECAFQELNKCEHKCHNTEGSYSCSCEEGYLLFKDFQCQACRLHSHWSSLDSSCKECPPHSYTLSEGRTSIADCICRPGFKGEPDQNKTCIDIDECLDNNFGCSHDCLNSLGSVMCTCPKGFKLEEDLKTCKDIDECNVKNGGCYDTCHNVEGGFYCSCPKGFLLSNTYFCTDINECEENNGNCSDICINVPGGYHCGCPSGFHLDRGGEKCRALLCPKFVVPNNAKVECFSKDDQSRKITLGKGEKEEKEEIKFPPNTICKAACKKGYTNMNTWADSSVACNDEGNWNASITLDCQGLQCSPLSIEDPVMQVHPPECSQKPMAVHSECHMTCPANYRLKGKPRFTCNKYLQWKPDILPACSPVNPFLTCPEDITLSLRDFNDNSALGMVPPPETNLNYMVKHRPDWVAVNTPTLFPLGKTEVIFTINEPRLNLSLTCNVFISVIDDVSPWFDYCPESFRVEAEDSFNGVQVTWKEPVAHDNVNIHSILKNLEPNTTLIPGVHNVKYVAKDAAGNEAECAFEINVQASSFECGELEDPLNGEANCIELLSGVICVPFCNENYIWSMEPLEPYTCDSTRKWTPSKTIPSCVPECKDGALWSEALQKCEFQTIDLGRNPE